MPNSSEVGRVSLGLVLDKKPLMRQMKGISGSLTNQFADLGKKLGGYLVAGLSIKALTSFSKQCLELGSDLAEVQNVVDVTFPHMSKKVNAFARDAAAAFGLSETMAKQFTGTFGAMGKAFGFSEKQAYDMSTTLTGLAGDVASFYNLDPTEAYNKLKSVFSGETESLKSLGVVMTQSALDQFAMENGFGKTTAAMSEQEKVALRYRFVLDRLSLAQGDFARTSDSWANQTRLLKLQFDSLKASIGQSLIAVLTPAIKALNALMGALVKAANTFKSFVFSLFGKKSEDMVSGTGAAISDSLGGMADSAGDAASGIEDVGDSTSKAAKEIKRSLAGFDQITKLTDFSTSESDKNGGGGSGLDLSSMLGDTSSALIGEDYSTELEDLGQEFAEKFKAAWEKADFTEFGVAFGNKINDALDKVNLDAAEKTAKRIAASIATFLNGAIGSIEWGKIGRIFSDGLSLVIGAGAEFIENFEPIVIFNAFVDFFKGVNWGGIASSAAELFGAAFGKAVKLFFVDLPTVIGEGLVNAISNVREFFKDKIAEAGGNIGKGILNGIAEVFSNIWDWVKEHIFTPFLTGFKKAFGIHSPASNPELLEAAENIGWGILNGIGGVFVDIKKWVQEHILDKIQNAINNGKELYADVKAKIKEFFTNSDGSVGITGAWANVKAWFNGTWKNSDGSIQGLGTVWGNVKAWFSSTYKKRDGSIDGLGTVWGNVKAWFNGAYKKSDGSVDGLGSAWANVLAWFNDYGTDLKGQNKPLIHVNAKVDKLLVGSGITAETKAGGGVFSHGKWSSIPQFSTGGAIVGGHSSWWDNLTKYAGGTSNAHGTLFAAGEAGPEVVGHIGGRTEVLNRSQLASTMFSAVSSAMRARERYTPQLAMIGASVSRSEQHLAMLAKQAESAASGGNIRDVVEILTQILQLLKTLDLDIYLDGKSIKDRLVKMINANTQATGHCEIIV